jgi:hypothetical protein
VKFPGAVDDPAALETLIGPVIAPTGTFAMSVLLVMRVTVAGLLLKNVTDVPALKFVPVMVTFVPTGPLVGLKLVTVGFRNLTTSLWRPDPL